MCVCLPRTPFVNKKKKKIARSPRIIIIILFILFGTRYAYERTLRLLGSPPAGALNGRVLQELTRVGPPDFAFNYYACRTPARIRFRFRGGASNAWLFFLGALSPRQRDDNTRRVKHARSVANCGHSTPGPAEHSPARDRS